LVALHGPKMSLRRGDKSDVEVGRVGARVVDVVASPVSLTIAPPLLRRQIRRHRAAPSLRSGHALSRGPKGSRDRAPPCGSRPFGLRSLPRPSACHVTEDRAPPLRVPWEANVLFATRLATTWLPQPAVLVLLCLRHQPSGSSEGAPFLTAGARGKQGRHGEHSLSDCREEIGRPPGRWPRGPRSPRASDHAGNAVPRTQLKAACRPGAAEASPVGARLTVVVQLSPRARGSLGTRDGSDAAREARGGLSRRSSDGQHLLPFGACRRVCPHH
jgi:hypothetical protein